MAIANMLCRTCRKNPVSKPRRTRDNEIIRAEIDFLNRRRHERKWKSRFSGEWEKNLCRSITTDDIFRENVSYFFLVIHQCKNICIRIHLHDFLKHLLCTSELDQHFMDNAYFHSHSIGNFFIFPLLIWHRNFWIILQHIFLYIFYIDERIRTEGLFTSSSNSNPEKCLPWNYKKSSAYHTPPLT